LAIALVLAVASNGRADIPGPGPRPRRPMPIHPENAVPLVIEVGADEAPARLLIPHALLGRAKKLAIVRGPALGNLPMAIGLTLTLAITGLGLIRFRKGRPARSLAGLLTLAAVLGLGTSMLWANAPPPFDAGRLRGGVVPIIGNGKELKLDSVRVELTENGETIRLIVPRAKLASLAGPP